MKTRLYVKFVSLFVLGGVMMGSACLPDRFWVTKWGEIVNRSIFGAINLILSNATGGTVTI